jgi:hypothetical protein
MLRVAAVTTVIIIIIIINVSRDRPKHIFFIL